MMVLNRLGEGDGAALVANSGLARFLVNPTIRWYDQVGPSRVRASRLHCSPAKGRNRRVLLVLVRPSEGPLTEPTFGLAKGNWSSCKKSCRSKAASQMTQEGGDGSNS